VTSAEWQTAICKALLNKNNGSLDAEYEKNKSGVHGPVCHGNHRIGVATTGAGEKG
jgi:hypothetical protein